MLIENNMHNYVSKFIDFLPLLAKFGTSRNVDPPLIRINFLKIRDIFEEYKVKKYVK